MLVIDHIESGGEINIELPFRPNSIGRYTFTVVVSPTFAYTTESPTNMSFTSEIKNLTFIIKALPKWWLRLDKVLEETKIDTLTNYSSIEGLEDNPLCQHDVQANLLLQRYGQALLDATSSNDDIYTSARFDDALNEISKFAQMLYCVDLKRLRYWDRAIANFWKDIAGKSENDFTLSEAILVTWNPALLVVDAIQLTGYSEIINTYQDFIPFFEKALNSYPTQTFGTAWLDAFGTGILVQFKGSTALKNIKQLLSDPKILGAGICPLANHALKNQTDRPCLYGIDELSGGCVDTEILQALAAANMLSPLIEGNLARKASVTLSGTPVEVSLNDLSYFGTSVSEYMSELCLVFDSIPPGKPSLPEDFPKHLRSLNGCEFAIISESLYGPGSGATGRIVRCLGQHQQSLLSLDPIPNPTQVNFPVPECFSSENEDSEYDQFMKEVDEDDDVLVVEYENGNKVVYHTKKHSGGIDVYSDTYDSSGRHIRQHVNSFDKDGMLVSSENINIKENGSVVSTKKEYHDGGGYKETVEARLSNNTITWESEKDSLGKKIGNTIVSYKKPPKGKRRRPIGPGEGGCGESAAVQRAELLYNCLFYEDPQIQPGKGPEPVGQPHGFGGGMPIPDDGGISMPACAASPWGNTGHIWDTRSSKFWNSTAPYGGAYDPPPWYTPGGYSGPPIKDFIPHIDGVIDPPKDWDIPRTYVPE